LGVKMWLLRLLGLVPTEEERKILAIIRRKQRKLARYGGRIVLGRKFSIRDEFETKEGRQAYNNSLKNKFKK